MNASFFICLLQTNLTLGVTFSIPLDSNQYEFSGGGIVTEPNNLGI